MRINVKIRLLTLLVLGLLALPSPGSAQIKVMTINTGTTWMNRIVNGLSELSITQVDASTIPTVDFSQFDVIYISDVYSASGTPAWATALNARQADIATYLTNGGGIVFGVQCYGGNSITNGAEYQFLPPGLVGSPPTGSIYGNTVTITVPAPIFVGVSSLSLSNWSSSYHSSFPTGTLPVWSTGANGVIVSRGGPYGQGKVVGWTQDPDYHFQPGGNLMVQNAIRWAVKGPRWISLSPAGIPPSARTDASIVYTRAANQLILFGGNPAGCTSAPSLNDTWSLSGANALGGKPPVWTQLSPAGAAPRGRQGHSAVYNKTTDNMVVFGGDREGCSALKLNDLFVLSNASGLHGAPTWQPLTPAGGPPPARSDHVAVYYQEANQMLIFGGTGVQASLTDLWLLTNADGSTGTPQWTQLIPAGSGPTTTSFMTGTLDASRDVLTLFAGWTCCSGPASNQVWLLSNASGAGGTPQWNLQKPAGTPPLPRLGASGYYRSPGSNAVYFGGSGMNDTWELIGANGSGALVGWAPLSPAGTPPPGRGGRATNAASAYDQDSVRGIIFGGKGPLGIFNDVWILAR